MSKSSLARVAVPLVAASMLLPWASPGMALLLGIAMALALGNPYQRIMRPWTSRLLSMAVIGLGAGMDLRTVARVGAHGFGYTLVGISLTLAAGWAVGRLLAVPRTIAILVAVGTAICGGSAIAAVAPVVRAKPQEISMALATVFLLNAIALFIFPPLGAILGLTQEQFGLWSGLAIHDTSSVVGAAAQFGPAALEVGTTVKLARALWIVPVTLGIAALQRRAEARQHDSQQDDNAPGPTRRPWFIVGFIAMAALVTYVPGLRQPGQYLLAGAKHLMVLTLFGIGASLTRDTLRSVGWRPLLQGVVLWVIAAAATLAALQQGWITLAAV